MMSLKPRQVAVAFCSLLLIGCASTKSKKQLSASDSVQSAKERMETTSEYIARAEKTLSEFEAKLKELRKDAASSEKIRGKERFILALGEFDGRLADARHELRGMQLANSQSWEAYQQRVRAADSVLKESFQNSLSQPSE